MEEPSFTIYFRGGPLHGRSRAGGLGCGAIARIGERYTIATNVDRGRISAIHEYEFTHVQGPMIVAQFVKTIEISEDTDQPSWGPWRRK